MSGIPLLFVWEDTFSFANVPCLLGPAQPAAIPAGRARSQSIMCIAGVLRVYYCLLSFLYQIRTNLFILYILYVGHLLSGMLLLVQGIGHLMYIIPLPITRYSPPAGADRDVITGSFLAYRRPGDRSLYLSGALRGGDLVLYVIYCLFCTEYELICSFNTFRKCI